MSLPVIPLDSESVKVRTIEVNEELSAKSKSELINEELEEMLDWESHDNPVIRRILRCYSLVYLRGELRDLVKRDIETYIVE